MLKKIKQLRQHAGFMRYFHNTSWLMGERILRMSVGLFVGIWIARYLGPEQFGLLSYAQSFVFLFTTMATLGLDGIVVRELVKDESKRDVLLGTAFGLKLIGAIIILPVLFLAVQFTNNDGYTNLLVFVIASATIFQSFHVIDFYYQSKVLSKYVAFANTVVLGLSSVIKIALLLNEAQLLTFALMTVFDGLVLAIGLVYFYIKKSGLKLFSWTFDIAEAKRLLNHSWPLILSGLVVSVYMRIDQIMIKEMLNDVAVGQYAAAVKISEAWYFIPMIVSSSVFPAILNAKRVSVGVYHSKVQKLYSLMIWISILIALPMSFLSDWVINLLYAGAYSQAGSVLVIHIWAGVFVFLGVASGKWLLAENLQVFVFRRALLGMIVNILLNSQFIPLYGVVGAAMATLIGQMVSALLFDFFHPKTRDMFWLKLKAPTLINNVLGARYNGKKGAKSKF